MGSRYGYRPNPTTNPSPNPDENGPETDKKRDCAAFVSDETIRPTIMNADHDSEVRTTPVQLSRQNLPEISLLRVADMKSNFYSVVL